MACHIARAIGADDHDPSPTPAHGGVQRRNEVTRRCDLLGRQRVQASQRREIDAVRRAEERLEVLGQVGLGQEREDAATVIVDHDEGDVEPAARGAEEAVRIVQEAQIAEERHDRTRRRGGHAKRGRDEAVDTVHAAIGEEPDAVTRRGEALDVAHRHARRDNE